MFKCDSCKENIPGKMFRVVVEKRKKDYVNKHKNKIINSTGWEIVKEQELCETCYERSKKNT